MQPPVKSRDLSQKTVLKLVKADEKRAGDYCSLGGDHGDGQPEDNVTSAADESGGKIFAG